MKLLSELNNFPDTTMNHEQMYLTLIYGKDAFGTLWSVSTIFENNLHYVRRLRYLMVRNKTQKINIYYKLERPVVDFIVNSSPLGLSSIPSSSSILNPIPSSQTTTSSSPIPSSQVVTSSSDLLIKISDEYQIYKTSKPMKVNLQLKQWMYLLLSKDELNLHDIETMFYQ